jgi:MYXO-CTERM domain-containing protein
MCLLRSRGDVSGAAGSMKALAIGAFSGALLLSRAAGAVPAHAICQDLGPTLGVGVSDFSAAETWPTEAAQKGVSWKFLYVYVVPSSDPQPAQNAFLQGKIALAKSLSAIPVFSFYELLELGQQNGITADGTEAGIVKLTLQNAGVMTQYFDNIIATLEVAGAADVPVLVHVEPDSWGFMMWAMGVDGQTDATQIPVEVGSSGHPDVKGFADNASGFGKALLKLRDQYAPTARMGWHASNFRTGTQPGVVTSFYSSMGDWDVLLTDQPYLEGDQSTWWLPLDPTKVQTNLGWFSSLSQATKLPILLWQAQIGTTDFHFFGGDTTLLASFAQAGLGGVMMDMRPNADTQPANVAPDDYRAHESDALATVPPASSMAGGTAADMRTRFIAYSASELAWPRGSLCASSGSGGVQSSGAGAMAGGCKCRATPTGEAPSSGLVTILAALALARRRRAGANKR